MEPPDHLKSHNQTFQALAYHLKSKHPLLQHNVKFCDDNQTLEMNFNEGDSKWRTIALTEARDALKQAKARKSRSWPTYWGLQDMQTSLILVVMKMTR